MSNRLFTAHFPISPMWGTRVPSAPTPTSFESSLSSHRRPSRSHSDPDTARAQPRNGIAFSNVLDSDDAGDVKADITPSSTLASKREAGERTEKVNKKTCKKSLEKGKIDREYSDGRLWARTCAPCSMASQIMSRRIWTCVAPFSTPVPYWVIWVQFYFRRFLLSPIPPRSPGPLPQPRMIRET